MIQYLGHQVQEDCPSESPANRQVRVLLLLGSLGGGGAERVAINLLHHCDPGLVDVRLGLLQRAGLLLSEIDPERVCAPANGPGRLGVHWGAPFRIVRMLRETRPDVLMTFGMGVDALTWVAIKAMTLLFLRRPRWICREDSNPTAEFKALSSNPLLRWLFWTSTRVIRGAADGFVTVSEDLAASLTRRPKQRRAATRVIPNPIDLDLIRRQTKKPPPWISDRPLIVSAGRLVRQKGFDLLIEAFAASPVTKGMDLVILGEGALETELRAQAQSLGVADRVHLAGFQSNPWAWFARARLFVLPSRWEGFGNVVAEAMACGAPTLVTDCDFGPREQIEHGVNGWIVPANDSGALAKGFEALLTQPRTSEALSVAGRSRAMDFDINAVAPVYTRLFLEQADRGTAIVHAPDAQEALAPLGRASVA